LSIFYSCGFPPREVPRVGPPTVEPTNPESVTPRGYAERRLLSTGEPRIATSALSPTANLNPQPSTRCMLQMYTLSNSRASLALVVLNPAPAFEGTRNTSNLLGPADFSFRALSGHLKFTDRRHKFNKDSPIQEPRPGLWTCHPRREKVAIYMLF